MARGKRKRASAAASTTSGGTSGSLEVDNRSKRRYEIPPAFDTSKTTYDVWKTTIEDWCFLTGTPPEEQGTAIRTVLTGEALQAAQHVSKEDIRSPNGVQKLLKELDRIFIPDAMVRNFLIQHQLFRMLRPDNRSVCEFINDFSDHYLKIRQTGQSLPQDTLAYLLLSNCNLNVEKIQLVMATLVSKNSVNITGSTSRRPVSISTRAVKYVNTSDRRRFSLVEFANVLVHHRRACIHQKIDLVGML